MRMGAAAPRVQAALPAQTASASGSIIRVHGSVFVDDKCREFPFTGWNT